MYYIFGKEFYSRRNISSNALEIEIKRIAVVLVRL